jgi:hypothetical protein
MLYSVITTIQQPTSSVYNLVKRLDACNGRLVVAGDSKGPAEFAGMKGESWPVDFLSLSRQETLGFRLSVDLPVKHYARKNIAYLQAIRLGASCIYETDDDNAPLDCWSPREEYISQFQKVENHAPRWVNVYKYFSNETIWPRGLPLDDICTNIPESILGRTSRRAPIQQGLVNGSSDVDAIWRLVMDRDFQFENGSSVLLERGNWCPFNTQSTWWWPVAYPLLYIPSYCSFRMCDIWKSFVAQRCLWEIDCGIVFHAPEVFQDRNPHDLMHDFLDEIVGYKENRRICTILSELPLKSGDENVEGNLVACYAALVEKKIFPQVELSLLDDWLSDIANLKCTT